MPLVAPAGAGAVVKGRYSYMKELVVLDSCRPGPSEVVPDTLRAALAAVRTPLRVAEWGRALRGHPDREFVDYLLDGMSQGFRIGFNRAFGHLKSAKRNMVSASAEPAVIEAYLAKKRAAGRVVGPLVAEGDLAASCIHTSRFGVIPKPHQPGKWRLIVDLSHPKGHSVNDGVDPGLCSLTYASVDAAAAMVLAVGRGAVLAKLDIASAYRIVPVHPDDRPLLGMRWNGSLYVDTALPFGLRSAPKLFTAVADGLEWILKDNGGCSSIHYLDDYLFVGTPGSGECRESLRKAESMCERLGVPLALEKREGPAHVLVFLGVVIDTLKLELRLPEGKLQRLTSLVGEWLPRRSCTKKELLSLIGHLQHASRIVRPGRPFLRRMIDLSAAAHELHHHIRLRGEFKSDLQWWAMFMGRWNGMSMMSSLGRATPEIVLTSDASGTWGCGAFLSSGEWFQCEWRGAWQDVHITAKELLPIVLACAMWAREWKGKVVKCLCDNAAVVAIVRSGRSKHPLVMHLMRSLSLFTAGYNVGLLVEHFPGRENVAADALSRGNRDLFFQQVPSSTKEPTAIPEVLLDVLVNHQPDWTSRTWRERCAATLQWV